MSRQPSALTELARLGFAQLGRARELLDAAGDAVDWQTLLPLFAAGADPDQALRLLTELLRRSPQELTPLLADPETAGRLIQVLGASEGFGEFFQRNPGQLDALAQPLDRLPGAEEYQLDLLGSVGGTTGVAMLSGETAVNALRIRYRRLLVQLAAYDLAQPDPLLAVDVVAAALADLAGAAIDAALAVARSELAGSFPDGDLAATRLAVIGMGKAGARELNYVSDVDVIFVTEVDDTLGAERAVEIATKLAMQTMRILHEVAREPALWEIDANLRPEGKDGALVRTLESHLAYYDRWAKSWEFQALLKARPLAGDRALGHRYTEAIAPKVWASASRENFVEGVQRMRERVTENLPADQADFQLKLGPGGLRDVEFTIQLLQLVHGQTDDRVRQAATLPALESLAEHGYIGRAEAAEFARDYRLLRLLEHRLQLTGLRRTHLMPKDADRLRVLARASGIASTAEELTAQWQAAKLAVRSLHERLFYRPLLSAVAALPDQGLSLSSGQAIARLSAIGFRDPKGALGHIAAMTGGVSRRAAIQRHLLPVMLQWFAAGADPDYGLLAFRRLSDELGQSHWYLRMLRDSSGAAQRLTSVLSGSRFVGSLLETIPEAAAWLEDEDDLRPRPAETLLEEAMATVARHEELPATSMALRAARRREVLRLAIGAIVGAIDIEELGPALADVTTAILAGILLAVRRDHGSGVEFAIIAMGRYGGRELGFGSDADVIYVYRAAGAPPQEAQSTAEAIVADLVRYTEDLRLPLELDIGLRPEGKNGPVVRSLESYRAYYRRWSLTWEAQALLRARAVAGDPALMADFEALADEVRFPAQVADADIREIRRIKARMESERLPQGADPNRHLKLGRGSLSDVEWLVQLNQLRHGARVQALRTPSTLEALAAAEACQLLTAEESRILKDAWIFASRTRSAVVLWLSKTIDVLPVQRAQLEGIARLMEYPPGSASRLEEDYLRVTRRARTVFERRFYEAGGMEHSSTG